MDEGREAERQEREVPSSPRGACRPGGRDQERDLARDMSMEIAKSG